MLNIDSTIQEILKGNVVIVPTDTVPGLAVDATSQSAIEKIYQIKKRDQNKKLPLLFSSIEMIEKYLEIDDDNRKLAEAFWPGGLTLVLKQKEKYFPQSTVNDAMKVGARIPANEDTRKLIEALGRPIAATSINISGEPSITDIELIPAEINAQVAGILAGNYTSSGKASTVVEVDNKKITLFREGEISSKQIQEIISS